MSSSKVLFEIPIGYTEMFVLVLILPCLCVGQEAHLSPVSYNASLGSSVTFHCSVTGAPNGIIWLIDGLLPESTQIRKRGIPRPFSDPVDGSPGSFESDLTIPATFINNNTLVQCFAAVFIGNSSSSLIVRFRVQGFLQEPPNLLIGVLNETHRRLSWDPPFTLDITDQDHDIIAYTVCDNITGSCENTTETQFIFPNLAVHIEFSVTAINIVGEGNTSTVAHYACEPAAVTAESVLRSKWIATVSFRSGEDPYVRLTFSQASSCFHVLTVETVSNSSQITTTHGLILPAVSCDGITISVSVTIADNFEMNEVYTASLTFISMREQITTAVFTTFDVQDVQVLVRPSSILVKCIFAEGSLALGCHLLIRDVAVNQSVSRNVTRSLLDNTDARGSSPLAPVAQYRGSSLLAPVAQYRGSSLLAPVAQYRESGLRSGRHTVLVFDLEEDGSVNANRWLYKQEIEVPQPSPVLSSSTSASIFNIASDSISSTISPSVPSPTIPTPMQQRINITAAIAGVATGSLIIILLTFLLTVLGVCFCHHRRDHCFAAAQKAPSPPVEQNLAYESVQIELRNVRHVVPNPAYGVVGRAH